jgi:hypothetical protein
MSDHDDAHEPTAPTTGSTAGPSSRRDPKDRPGRVRLFVAVGDRPARWYRSPGEAADDARTLLAEAKPGEVVARAWLEEPADGAPDWELRRGIRRTIVWARLRHDDD